MDYWRAFQCAAACTESLLGLGIEISVERDFARTHLLMQEIGKPSLSPFFDPDLNSFTERNGLWLLGRKAGRLVLMGGVRMDDFRGDSPSFLKAMFNRGYGPDCCKSVDDEVAWSIDGRVAYLGDLQSAASSGLGRRSVRMFVAIAHYLAATQFQADCSFSFMRGADVLRGSADTNGFDSRIIDPVVWGEVPNGWGPNLQLVYRQARANDRFFAEVTRELACTRSGSEADRASLLRAAQA